MKPDEILHDKLESLVPDLQLDVPAENLIKRGRRMRAARQSLIASGAAVAVAGITVAGVALSGHHTSTVQTASNSGSQLQPADLTCGVSPQPTVGAPAASNDGAAATPWGAAIQGASGVAGTDVVVHAFHIAGMQCTNVGFEFAVKNLSTGATTPLEATNEFEGSYIAPGFHGAGLTTGPGGWYVVGYYVGPAAAISIPANGQPASAHLASWAVNPDVKVWWVHGTGPTPTLGTPDATDGSGAPLPGGARNGQPGVG